MDTHSTSKLMHKNNFTSLIQEVVDPDYYGKLEFVFQEGGEDCLFLHLDVINYTPSVLKKLRKDLEEILEQAANSDIQSVSFVVPEQLTSKFHKQIKPLDYEIVENGNIIGGWYTEA